MAFSLSPNGELLGLSCIYVDSGVIKSRVAFYNFGTVGENKSDFYVNGYTYPDTVIPTIRFMNNGMAYALGDDRLVFYSGTQIPEAADTYLYEEEVQGVYSNENYVGVLFRNSSTEEQHLLKVYQSSGNRVGEYLFNLDFDHLFFGQDNFVAYNEQECLIRTFGGVDKFQGEFVKAAKVMIPLGNSYRYVILTNDSIDTIQLK